MKIRLIALTLALLLACGMSAAGESPALTPLQQALHDSVWYCMDLPKDAQILQASEYYCKAEGFPLRLMLIVIEPDADTLEKYGSSARLAVCDMDSDAVVTCRNIIWPEGSAQSREEALHMIFSHWDSEISHPDGIIYADHEMLFPVSSEDLAAVNAVLAAHITP